MSLRTRWALVLTAALVASLAALSWHQSCPETGTIFEWKCRHRIHRGMTLAEAERVLGQGKREPSPSQPTVFTASFRLERGDELYSWEKDGLMLWVGFHEGRVCGKWLEVPYL